MILFRSAEVIPEGFREISEEKLKEIVIESRWQLGIGMIGGNKLPIERKKTLGSWSYRLDNKEVTAPIEMYMPTEFLHWRDD